MAQAGLFGQHFLVYPFARHDRVFRKRAPGRSQIGRSSMTGGVSCQIFRLRHCLPRYRSGFFGQPVARV